MHLEPQNYVKLKIFFENDLGFEILEFSYEHFVLYMKEIRIVFIYSDNKTLEVELYIDEISNRIKKKKDPNGIKIINMSAPNGVDGSINLK